MLHYVGSAAVVRGRGLEYECKQILGVCVLHMEDLASSPLVFIVIAGGVVLRQVSCGNKVECIGNAHVLVISNNIRKGHN